MKQSYLFGHWIITLLVAPITSQTLQYVFGKNPHQVVGLLEVYPISLIFSLAFSLPTFLIYLLFFYFLSKSNINFIIAKITLILISVVGVIITISIIKGSMSKDIAMAYSLTSIIVGILLRLKSEKSYKSKQEI